MKNTYEWAGTEVSRYKAPGFTDPIEPMEFANMRQNGVRPLWVQCNQCRHTGVMNVNSRRARA
jgi:hypothetical protein